MQGGWDFDIDAAIDQQLHAQQQREQLQQQKSKANRDAEVLTSESAAAAQARKSTSQKHREKESQRRYRIKERLMELGQVCKCSGTTNGAILDQAIKRVRECNARISMLKQNLALPVVQSFGQKKKIGHKEDDVVATFEGPALESFAAVLVTLDGRILRATQPMATVLGTQEPLVNSSIFAFVQEQHLHVLFQVFQSMLAQHIKSWEGTLPIQSTPHHFQPTSVVISLVLKHQAPQCYVIFFCPEQDQGAKVIDPKQQEQFRLLKEQARAIQLEQQRVENLQQQQQQAQQEQQQQQQQQQQEALYRSLPPLALLDSQFGFNGGGPGT